MTKNTGSQVIGAQLVSATDGSAFTSAVTVYVTGDAGTQAVGSVGSGACTHEGNGYHTYAPAQAETNYDVIAFTFIGTGAVPVTVQVFTTAQAKGSTTLATASALSTAQTDLDTLTGSDGATLATSQPNYAPATASALTTVDTVVDAIKVVTDALTSAAAAKLAASALGLITGTVDTGSFTPTTTQFEADDITEATADHYIGRIVTFTSGALLGQSTDITDYALSGANGHFTVTALTEAPANDVTFVIS